MDTLHIRLPAFLMNLDCLSAEGQVDAFVNEVLETFGRFDPPAGDRSHRWELELHGICADGATEDEAVTNWKRLARKRCLHSKIAEVGFITDHLPINQIKVVP